MRAKLPGVDAGPALRDTGSSNQLGNVCVVKVDNRGANKTDL